MNTKPPSLIDRLRLTFNFYKYGTQFLTKKKSDWPFILPAWRENVPQWHIQDYQTLINEGFNRNSILYSAAMYKYKSYKMIPMRAYRGTPDEKELLPLNHPLQKLCLRPNRFQSGPTFQGLADIFLNMAGICYILFKRAGDEVDSMYLLRPDRVYIVPLTKGPDPIGYYYVPEGRGWQDGIPYQAKDVMVVRMPNPGDDLDGLGEGLAPGSVAAKSINVDNMITDFLQLFFQNGAMPPGYLSYDTFMEPEVMKETRNKWMEIYGGYEEWTKVAVLDQGGKYTRVGLTFAEMDVSKLDARTQSLIVSPFGVPLSLITSREELVQSTYNNKKEDREMFWEDTMTAEAREFEAEYQYYLQGPRGEFVMFDFSQVPALTMTAQERGEQAKNAFTNGGILRNEYRAVIGFDPVDDGDVYLVPSSAVETPYRTKAELEAAKAEAEALAAQPTPEPEPPPVPEEQPQEEMPEAENEAEEAEQQQPTKRLKKKIKNIDRLDFATKTDGFATSYEYDFEEAATDAFEADERAMLALVKETETAARQDRSSIDWMAMAEGVAAYLVGAGLKNWQDKFNKPMEDLMTARILDLNQQFGFKTKPADLLRQEWFNEYTITFAQPINDTTEQAIRNMLEQASDEGWSVPDMQKRLELLFQQWMAGTTTPEEWAWYQDRMPEYRRELIARTETLRGANVVSYELYKNWKVEKIEWLATNDNRVRPTHAALDGTVIEIGSTFDVGGYEARYPGDMSLPPGEVCNCRCTTIPVL